MAKHIVVRMAKYLTNDLKKQRTTHEIGSYEHFVLNKTDDKRSVSWNINTKTAAARCYTL